MVVLNNKPDGTNINLNCGALYPADLQKAVLFHQADIGIAHDGDADRTIIVDKEGRVVPGEATLSVFAQSLRENNNLVGNTLVTTEMSNKGLDLALQPLGIKVVRTAVGDRYVLEKMLSGGYNFGGESSGHTIFLDYNTTGDGIISALQFLSLMQRTGKTVSQLTKNTHLLPQVLVNVIVRKKTPLHDLPEVQKVLSDYEERMNGKGRLLVRYSGTEKVLRIMIEGEDQKAISKMAQHLASIVEKEIGA